MFRSPGPIALVWGPLTLRWYGLLAVAGMAVGLWLAYREARRRGLDAGALVAAGLVALLVAVIGARLSYVLLNLDYYLRFPRKIPALWEGGVALHGGLVAGVLAGAVAAWAHRLPILASLDAVAPGLVLGQAIASWGDFFNEQAFGAPTALPWGLFVSPLRRPIRYAQDGSFHPLFLYESLWSLALFALLWLVLRRRLERAPGTLFLACLGLYSLGRFWLEALRVDPLLLGPLRVGQLASVVAMAVALVGVPWLLRRAALARAAG